MMGDLPRDDESIADSLFDAADAIETYLYLSSEYPSEYPDDAQPPAERQWIERVVSDMRGLQEHLDRPKPDRPSGAILAPETPANRLVLNSGAESDMTTTACLLCRQNIPIWPVLVLLVIAEHGRLIAPSVTALICDACRDDVDPADAPNILRARAAELRLDAKRCDSGAGVHVRLEARALDALARHLEKNPPPSLRASSVDRDGE